jgi:hypothetical protein
MATRPLIIALLSSALGFGCGPGSGDKAPNCLQVQPCGGDVVGTWSFLGACTNAAAVADLSATLAADCPGAAASAVGVDVSGTVTYNADLTYSVNGSETVSATETVPLACLGVTTCAGATTSTAGTTVTCTGTTTCTCQIHGVHPITEAGTYTTSGTTQTTTSATSVDTNPYCVENNRLHLLDTATMSQTIVLDVVAQKQ